MAKQGKNSNKFSATDKFKMIMESMQAVNKSVEAFKEFKLSEQETIRHKVESDVRLKKIDADVEKTLSDERVKLAKIEKEYRIEMKQLENEEAKFTLTNKAVNRYIDYLDNLQKNYFEWKNKFGIEDSRLEKVSADLHKAMITLPQFLTS